LCSVKANRDKIEKYIAKRYNSGGGSGDDDDYGEWSYNYETRQLQKLQFLLIERFDSKSSADDYIDNNIENPDFRRIAIKKALVRKSFERAERLCLDGEEQDSKYAGLVREWMELRYRVYEKTKDIEAQKTLALKLLIDGEFNYFSKLKALYTKDEWAPVLEDVLTKARGNNRTGVYLNIIIHEKLKNLLLEYCKKNTSLVTSYYKHLLPEYKTDVAEMFVDYINRYAERADNRSRYREVCGIIKLYKKACGSVADTLWKELSLKYARRPAFVDELSKLKNI
jgi:hypothetical protein